MQLVMIYTALFLLIVVQEAKGQIKKITGDSSKKLMSNDNTTITTDHEYVKPDWQTIDINFLSSYYAQDGNNGAVTGGIGTEQLTDFTQKVSVVVPLQPNLQLNVDGGYDYYSSASTDNIDNIRSSDSASDMRTHGNVGLNYELSDTRSVGFRLGGSVEYDYISFNGGLSTRIASEDQNTVLGVSAQAFIDKWSVIFPSELRRTSSVPTDRRNSFNASISLSQVISQRTQVQFQLEGTYMDGLLSTPFHRVYFQEQDAALIENLPSTRLKIPLGFRVNSHLSDHLIMRAYYRYYWDDWGMSGHTASLELPVKISRFFSVAPFYRYHTQSAADYFAPYKEHSLTEQYYTSDFDLSQLTSHAFGVGISYGPPEGLAKMKIPFTKKSVLRVKSIDLKYSHYDRSTGLGADIISLGLSFSL